MAAPLTTKEYCYNDSNVRIRNFGIRMQCSNAPAGVLHAVIDADTIEILPGEHREWDISRYGHIAVWFYDWFEWYDGQNWQYVPQSQTYTAKPGNYFPEVGCQFTPGKSEGHEPVVRLVAEAKPFELIDSREFATQARALSFPSNVLWTPYANGYLVWTLDHDGSARSISWVPKG